MTEDKILKSGYSTGSHATSALKAALVLLLNKEIIENVEINLPDGEEANLPIEKAENDENYAKVQVIKSYNDDIDVTKGCKIICYASHNLDKISCNSHRIQHKPHELAANSNKLIIYAGKGLGIVTKWGLKLPVGFPAINPATLQMMNIAFAKVMNKLKQKEQIVYISFEVENGEEIAKNTANFKAGVVGGISLLGTKGIVKPVSTDAYLDSLDAEINVASQNFSKQVVFTIGNSSLEFAQRYYELDDECYIEIGNFVYDCIHKLVDFNFEKLILCANLGKMTKIAQAKKNTNNRFGDIDFVLVKQWLLENNYPEKLISLADEVTTVKAIEEVIESEYGECLKSFYDLIIQKAFNVIALWINEAGLDKIDMEIVLTDGKQVKGRFAACCSR